MKSIDIQNTKEHPNSHAMSERNSIPEPSLQAKDNPKAPKSFSRHFFPGTPI